jgi:glycerol-3-phosphate acyltransferase PlsY
MDPETLSQWIAGFVIGYLLGSIPFGLLITRFAGLGDIRETGSGNIGATNVLRTGHKGLAAATLLLDAGKGALAVFLLRGSGSEPAALLAGFGAVLGHMFPSWLAFRGGKGVATGLGVLLAVTWPVGVLACAIWCAVVAWLRISSAGALAAFAVALVAAALLETGPVVALVLVMTVLVYVRHLSNLRRLADGTEPRIGAARR